MSGASVASCCCVPCYGTSNITRTDTGKTTQKRPRADSVGAGAHPIPKGAPCRKSLGELVGGEGAGVALRSGTVGGTGQRVADVPAMEPPALEVPLAVHPDIGVPVLEHPLGPL